jgi:hypothetical protein
MSPYEVYIKYLSLKKHFTNQKYDYFKYNGKTKASVAAFNRRKDRYFFERTSRKYQDKQIIEFFVSNFISSDNPSNLWIGEIINSGEKIYTEWTKRQQSLSYLFKQQSEDLFSSKKLESVFDCSKGHPILLKKYLKNEISIENMVIYELIFSYCNDFDKKLLDPVWEIVSLKIKKYKPFIHIGVISYKNTLRNIINE